MIYISGTILSFIVAISFTFMPGALAADSNGEVSHLLAFIEGSNCTFIRNGKNYSSSKAKQHLEYKYNSAKSRLSTAEDFVRKIASKSSLSGKAYAINCAGKPSPVEEWLMAELNRYRQHNQQSADEPPQTLRE